MSTNEWKEQFRMNEEQIAKFAGLSKPPAKQMDLFESYEDGTDDDDDDI